MSITDHGLNGSLEYRLDFPASSAFGTVLMYVYIISLIVRKFWLGNTVFSSCKFNGGNCYCRPENNILLLQVNTNPWINERFSIACSRVTLDVVRKDRVTWTAIAWGARSSSVAHSSFCQPQPSLFISLSLAFQALSAIMRTSALVMSH